MSYVNWHAGMKVVCLDIEWPPLAAAAVANGCRLPEPGRIYTIREIDVDARDGKVYVRLCEIRNPRVKLHPWSPGEPKFGARRFRPLQPRKTDISIFTDMLRDQRDEVSA